MRGITLTTDFGLEDWFVGVMKGVLSLALARERVRAVRSIENTKWCEMRLNRAGMCGCASGS
ncbi:MAG: hypothetical protein A3G75_00285 [Verrucomicrobia bacterium RIFCSPLOWO2_12_FULL_64_8]|nr:MAG: hypothetical protein A3G75_00285 [Verrucomicrobia bacterium RIFCSPLOWO2_12_FULL_64_8]